MRCKPIWQEVRDPKTGKLLFRYAKRLRLVEVVKRRQKTVVDLNKLNGEGDNEI